MKERKGGALNMKPNKPLFLSAVVGAGFLLGLIGCSNKAALARIDNALTQVRRVDYQKDCATIQFYLALIQDEVKKLLK